MSAPPLFAKLPRPALFALTGVLAGLLAALTAGELVWYALRPEPSAPAPEVKLDSPKPEAPATPRPAPRLAITAAPVAVYPGGKNAFGVRVARDRFDAPVVVRFDSPDGLRAAEVTVPAGSGAGQAEVVAPPDAKAGTYTLTAIAVAVTDEHTLRARTPTTVTVNALPPPPARMAVSVSPRVSAYQKSKNTFAVRVARADFDEPIEVTFENLPDGVKIPAITVPPGKTEAVAEMTAEAGAQVGASKVTATARAAPKGVATSAAAEVVAEVLDPNRAPLDVVLVLDCTGSMRKSVDGLWRNFPALGDALTKARFDVRFGLVGFRDTTLNQPLEAIDFGGERMTADAAQVAAAVRGLRLGGGGGEGESSLDGVAKAADYPLRIGAARVILLVTDGPPKRVDQRVRSTDDAVKHLRARRIDQLHVVTLPDFRKRFEPLWDGAKGAFVDLKGTTERGEFDRVMSDLSRTITDAVPPLPVPKPAPAAPAATAVLPDPMSVKTPLPPASPEPDEPPLSPAPPLEPLPLPAPVPSESRKPPAEAPAVPLAAVGAWAAAVVCVACVLLFFVDVVLLSGEGPTVAALVTGYGGGLTVGLVAGAMGYIALDAVGISLLARVGSAGLFGLLLGLSVAMTELLFRADAARATPRVVAPLAALPAPRSVPLPPLPPPVPAVAPPKAPVQDLDLPPVEAYPSAPSKPRIPLLDLDLPPVEAYPSAPVKPLPPPAKPLIDWDLPPVEAYPGAPKAPSAPPPPTPASPPPAAPPVHKPNISGAPKPADGCPGCGRKIPGVVGKRYCMVCDKTF